MPVMASKNPLRPETTPIPNHGLRFLRWLVDLDKEIDKLAVFL
jgi:hypothetical protein